MFTHARMWRVLICRAGLAAACVASGLAASGCERAAPAGGGSSESEENLTQVKKDDPRIAAAAEEARRRWPEFVAAFRKKSGNRTAYAVKLAFPIRRESGSEHMWIQVESIEGSTIRGTLNNDPIGDVGVKLGDSVTTTTDKVEDWLIASGKDDMLGGFSIKVLEEIEREQSRK